MKIHVEHNGTVFEFESRPMKEGRFRALCALSGVVAYVSMVAAVAALRGLPGLVTVGVVTLLCMAIGKGMD